MNAVDERKARVSVVGLSAVGRVRSRFTQISSPDMRERLKRIFLNHRTGFAILLSPLVVATAFGIVLPAIRVIQWHLGTGGYALSDLRWMIPAALAAMALLYVIVLAVVSTVGLLIYHSTGSWRRFRISGTTLFGVLGGAAVGAGFGVLIPVKFLASELPAAPDAQLQWVMANAVIGGIFGFATALPFALIAGYRPPAGPIA